MPSFQFDSSEFRLLIEYETPTEFKVYMELYDGPVREVWSNRFRSGARRKIDEGAKVTKRFTKANIDYRITGRSFMFGGMTNTWVSLKDMPNALESICCRDQTAKDELEFFFCDRWEGIKEKVLEQVPGKVDKHQESLREQAQSRVRSYISSITTSKEALEKELEGLGLSMNLAAITRALEDVEHEIESTSQARLLSNVTDKRRFL